MVRRTRTHVPKGVNRVINTATGEVKIIMTRITKNILSHELECSCKRCSVRIQSHEPIIHVIQSCCDHFAEVHEVEKVTLEITSAARCYEYNRSHAVGSNDESQHPRCSAMDIKIFIKGEQVDPYAIYSFLNKKYHNRFGLGLYPTFTHCDTREIKARWGQS